MADLATAGSPFVAMLAEFVRELRAEGLRVGTGDLLTYCAAMEPLDPTDLVDLYWAGHAALVQRREQVPTYQRVFRRYFLDEGSADDRNPVRQALRAQAETATALEIPRTEPDPSGGDEDPTTLGLMASDAELLRDKSFAECTPEELAAVRRMVTQLRLTPPCQRSRRTERAPAGTRPDLRRTLRATLRAPGDTGELFWRRRRVRPRPVVLILDVSGSMADHSRALLQFAWSARQATSRVEVFCFGTRLTRITKALERRRPDDAMSEAARAVFDWEGGTRIGESLTTFVRDWGQRGQCRRSIVVICSDGHDRGDPEVLAGAMERLARLSHRIVWVHPHAGDDPADVPRTLGMAAAAPHVDEILPGGDLRSLERFATRLPHLG